MAIVPTAATSLDVEQLTELIEVVVGERANLGLETRPW